MVPKATPSGTVTTYHHRANVAAAVAWEASLAVLLAGLALAVRVSVVAHVVIAVVHLTGVAVQSLRAKWHS